VTPAELPGYLEAIRARVEAAAVPVVDAIAETYKEHLVGYTLHESGENEPVTRTPAVPGRPPAFMPGGKHGSLAGSVIRTPGTGSGGVATSIVAPKAIYSATLQWGAVHTGKPWMWLWVAYIGPGEVRRRGWVRHTVKIPAYPYMDVAVDETIVNGSLERAGISAFMAAVWGR